MNNKKFALLAEHLVMFLKNEIEKVGFNRVVYGLSGGLDSAVVGVLLLEAFGKDFVHSIMMPSCHSSKSSIDDARELCCKFDMQYEIVNIDGFLDSYNDLSFTQNSSSLRIGNFSARVRMSILFDISQKLNAMVVGTSNKSELMLGYGTWYGDLASSLNPIGDIYKSELFLFAKYLGITDNIIKKTPSADLWDGQSDEDELGFSYAKIDAVLIDFVEHRIKKKELLRKYDNALVEMVLDRVFKNQFKRKTSIIAKITDRTIGHDFLYPRDIKV